MKTSLFAAAVIVPILAMAGWLFQINSVVSGGRLVYVAVRGYDPRDLLAGHYLTYQLDLGEMSPCDNAANRDKCVCFTESNSSDQLSAVMWAGACDQRPVSCAAFLQGQCQHSRFEAGVERFYFSEAMQDQLLTIPPGGSVMIKTDSNGRGVVVDFLVEGRALKDYVAEAREKMKAQVGSE